MPISTRGWLPLPSVHGLITVRPNGQLTRLTFDGQYAPPLGPVGRLFDAVLGRWLAQLAVRRMVDEMASFVESREKRMRAGEA